MNINTKSLLVKLPSDFQVSSDGKAVGTVMAEAKYMHYQKQRNHALSVLKMRFQDLAQGKKVVLKQKFDTYSIRDRMPEIADMKLSRMSARNN